MKRTNGGGVKETKVHRKGQRGISGKEKVGKGGDETSGTSARHNAEGLGRRSNRY